MIIAGLVLAAVLVFALKHERATETAIAVPVAGSSRSSAGTPAVTSATRTVALPRLVDVGADKCIPCKAMVPVLDALRREYAGKLQVDFVDAWKYPEQAAPFNVYGIPTQIFFDPSGRELHRHLGFISKEEILATWRQLGFPLIPGEKG